MSFSLISAMLFFLLITPVTTEAADTKALERREDFGPLPELFMDYRSTVPLSVRIELDLRNIEEYRIQRTEIIKNRIGLLMESVQQVREISEELSTHPTTSQIYKDIADKLENEVLLSHRIHNDLAIISDPESSFVKSLQSYKEEAKQAEGQSIVLDGTKLHSQLTKQFNNIYLYAKNVYAQKPLKLFEKDENAKMRINLVKLVPEEIALNFTECKFNLQAIVRRDIEDKSSQHLALVEDSKIIAKIIDGNPAQGIKPLSINCGTSANPGFSYNNAKNRIYNTHAEDQSEIVTSVPETVKSIKESLN